MLLAHLLEYLGVPSGVAIVVSIRVMRFIKGRLGDRALRRGSRNGGRSGGTMRPGMERPEGRDW